MARPDEKAAFADRLRKALQSAGVRPSPTVVAHEFNRRSAGASITPHSARNWLLGNALPTQDKLRVLADWLQVSPNALRFGAATLKVHLGEADTMAADLDMADREMLRRYLNLRPLERRLVREFVDHLNTSSLVRRGLPWAPSGG